MIFFLELLRLAHQSLAREEEDYDSATTRAERNDIQMWNAPESEVTVNYMTVEHNCVLPLIRFLPLEATGSDGSLRVLMPSYQKQYDIYTGGGERDFEQSQKIREASIRIMHDSGCRVVTKWCSHPSTRWGRSKDR